MTLELWTLDGGPEEVEEVIALLRLTLNWAQEAELISPETVSALRKWCNTEWAVLHPAEEMRRFTTEEEVKEALRRSPHWPFWEALKAEQEVRWTGTKSATYFVVDPTPSPTNPSNPRSRLGAYIELRRHTGKTFWSHIIKVRPLGYVEAEEAEEAEGTEEAGSRESS